MGLGGILHSKGKDDWATPFDFFDRVNARFNFSLDACASSWNTKCGEYYTRENSGLTHPWKTWTWCNPPYSDILSWYSKAYLEAQNGNSSVVLTFARTDTKAFHTYAARATEIIFLQGRIKFIDPATKEPGDPAPAPSMLVIFDATKNLEPHKMQFAKMRFSKIKGIK